MRRGELGDRRAGERQDDDVGAGERVTDRCDRRDSAFRHRFVAGVARPERNVMPGTGERSAQDGADKTGADHCNIHSGDLDSGLFDQARS